MARRSLDGAGSIIRHEHDVGDSGRLNPSIAAEHPRSVTV
jgi:hypothetical protein